MRQYWEYKNIWVSVFDVEGPEIDAPMNVVGRDGWELVCSSANGRSDSNKLQYLYTFKRPLRNLRR